jgi:biotin synthase
MSEAPCEVEAPVDQVSPDYVRISAAAAMELGLVRGRMMRGCGCGCINLLQTYAKSCYSNCSYCGLARLRPGLSEEKSFIRVDWPVFPTDLVAQKIAEKEAGSTVGRVCVSQVQHPRAYADLVDTAARVHAAAPMVPISALVSATTLDEDKLGTIKESGVDIIGVGLDAVTPELFYKVRGRGSNSPHDWDHHWRIIGAARQMYGPMKVNCHVMVGLGETDKELATLFEELRDQQIAAYLFSFNPEEGTAMGDVPRAPLHRWRRIQLVKYLIEEKGVATSSLAFDADGGLAHIDVDDATVQSTIDEALPFMTNGCPDREGKMSCNRPFGSYRPGEAYRDYPFMPNQDDLAVIRGQLQLGEVMVNK